MIRRIFYKKNLRIVMIMMIMLTWIICQERLGWFLKRKV